MIRALAVLVVGLAAAVATMALALVFGLNGEQWAWWESVSWIGAALLLALTVQAARGRRGRPSRAHAAAFAAGAAVVAVSVWLMARSYSDPYAGPLLWPHVLACVALAGFALAAGGLYLAVSSRR